jgi:hypothetical protein
MPAETTNLFLVEDLEDISRTSKLADSDLDSLRIVADWINTFITQPHKELGRIGVSLRARVAGTSGAVARSGAHRQSERG